MSAIAVAGMAASAWSSNQQKNASEDAQRRQEQGISDAMQGTEAQQRYNQQLRAPLIQAGNQALTERNALLGLGGDTEGAQRALESSAGYQSGRIGGERGLAAMAGARGGMASGRAMTAANRFGQDYATGQRRNRLAELSDTISMGNQTGRDAMSSGDMYANRMGGYQTGLGDIGAAGSLGRANSRQSTLSGMYGLARQGYQDYQDQQPSYNTNQGGYTGGGVPSGSVAPNSYGANGTYWRGSTATPSLQDQYQIPSWQNGK